MKKSRFGMLGYLLVAITGFWLVPGFTQEPSPPAKTAEEAYKNIQVLKGVPAPELMNIMKNFAHSLGVKCTFCHVQGDFASDDNPHKNTARQMINMARGINKDNFGGEHRVTCWTCHHGASEPESKPPQAAESK